MRILLVGVGCWLFLGLVFVLTGCSAAPQLTPRQRVELGMLGAKVACGECTLDTCGADITELCGQVFPRAPDLAPPSGDAGQGVRSVGGAPAQ